MLNSCCSMIFSFAYCFPAVDLQMICSIQLPAKLQMGKSIPEVRWWAVVKPRTDLSPVPRRLFPNRNFCLCSIFFFFGYREKKVQNQTKSKRNEKGEVLVGNVSIALLGLSTSVGTIHSSPEHYWFYAWGFHAKLYFCINCNFISGSQCQYCFLRISDLFLYYYCIYCHF